MGEFQNLKIGNALFLLKEDLVRQQFISDKVKPEADCFRTLKREDILHRIEAVVLQVVQDIAAENPPKLTYPSTTDWKDVCFEPGTGIGMRQNLRMTTIRFESLQSVKKLGLMIKVLAMMYRLVKTDSYCTKRDMYYQDPSLFGSQHIVDGIVDNISCMLQVPRWQLHTLATSKGCIVGDLQFQDADNNYIDCSNSMMGVQVPNHVNGMKNLVTNANFILIVEKDASFQKLLESKVCEKLGPCIIITGKGFPDINSRMLLRRLWNEFSIPILALVDADPHGIEIMAVYKFGSKALSFETEHLAVPCIKWLGVLPSDISRLGIPETSLVPLSKADRDKAQELLNRPYMQHHPMWRKEVVSFVMDKLTWDPNVRKIELMLHRDKKAEIQALDSIASNFLTEVYLPSKIRCAGWL